MNEENKSTIKKILMFGVIMPVLSGLITLVITGTFLSGLFFGGLIWILFVSALLIATIYEL